MICKNCCNDVDGRRSIHCDTCDGTLHKECAIHDGGTFCDVCYVVKSEEHTVTFDIPEVIRRSYIETYKSCPYDFYLSVVKKMEPPSTIYTQLGIDLHEMFDKASHGLIDYPSVVDWFETYFYDDLSYQFDLSQDDKIRFHKRGVDCIDTFFEINQTMPKPLITEQKITFSVGEGLPHVSITMDRINEVDGELEIVDYKTGAVMVGNKLSTDLQAPLYLYAVREHFNRPVRKFTLYYLSENKERVFVRDPNNADRYICTVGKREYSISLLDAIKEVQRLFSRIIKGDFNVPKDTKKMYFNCKMCHKREIGACEGADVQVWKQFNERT